MTSAATPDQAVQTDQVYQIYIRATAEQIWQAITDPEFVRRYFFGARLEAELTPGGTFRSYSPDGTQLWNDTTVMAADPPCRLVHGWQSRYDPECAGEPDSRVTWEIEPADEGICMLTVIHDRLENSPKTAANVYGPGWMFVLSNLKSFLETGEPLISKARP